MPRDVTQVFAEKLAHNRGPDPRDPDQRQPCDYGVIATLDENILTVDLTFRTGAVYCCMEWACHLGLFDRWDWVRRGFAEKGITAPEQLELKLTCIIEEGAIFFDLFKPDPVLPCWYEFKPVAAYRYEVSALEAEA